MLKINVHRLVAVAGLAAAFAIASPAQAQWTTTPGRLPQRTDQMGRQTTYNNLYGQLFRGINVTRSQRIRLDNVTREYGGTADVLNNRAELNSLRSVLGPGERRVFDANVDAARQGGYGNGRWNNNDGDHGRRHPSDRDGDWNHNDNSGHDHGGR